MNKFNKQADQDLTSEASGIAADQEDAERSGSGKPILHTVQLCDIYGIHSSIKCMQIDLKLPPFIRPARKALNDPALLFVVRRNPIWAIREKGKLRCIGNIDTYGSMCSIFTDESKIHCIEFFSVDDDAIRRNYLSELLYGPALFGIHASELGKLTEVARRANELGFWAPPVANKSKASAEDVNKYMAKVYGVDVRKLKSKTANQFNPTQVAEVAPWDML